MITVNDNIKVNAGKPLDAKYLNGVAPYANTAAAIAAIPLAERSLGLTVLIGSVEYWWKNGLTDPDLIVKSSGGGLSNPVCELQLQKVQSPNTLGAPVVFSKANCGTNVDIITAGVTEIKRGATSAIYNVAVESSYNYGISPANTEWNSVYTDPINNGHANIQNVETRIYSDFATALNNAVGANILTTPLVMHDLITDKYYLFTFTAWQSGGGAVVEASGTLDISTYPPADGTVVTIGTRTYTYDLINDQWTNLDGGVYIDLNDCINADPQTVVYTDYGNPTITLYTAQQLGVCGNSVVTTVTPAIAGFAFANPTLTGGSGGGGAVDYTRTEVIIGAIVCSGAIVFNDGSQQTSAANVNGTVGRIAMFTPNGNSVGDSQIYQIAGVSPDNENFVFGRNNTLTSGNQNFVAAQSTTSINDFSCIILGNANYSEQNIGSYVLGDSNNIQNSSFINVVGEQNAVVSGNYLTVQGLFNQAASANATVILGHYNSILVASNETTVVGYSNTITNNAQGATIIGRNNTASFIGTGATIIGNGNTLTLFPTSVFIGNSNKGITVYLNTGRVGIGTLAPGAKLHVIADSAVLTEQALDISHNVTGSLLKVRNDGRVNIANLPTSNVGLVAGDLWNNAGVVNIV